MTGFATAYDRLLTACGYFAGLSIAALALLVTADVVMRNLGIGNLPWLTEVAEYALYGTTFIAAPWVLHQGSHVRVDVLVQRLPPRMATVLDAAVDVTGLAISLILFYYSLEATRDAYSQGSLIFKELVIPEWWPLTVLPVSFALLSVEFARRLVQPFLDGTAGAQPPQGPPDGL